MPTNISDEFTDRDKCTSLLWFEINTGREKFYIPLIELCILYTIFMQLGFSQMESVTDKKSS